MLYCSVAVLVLVMLLLWGCAAVPSTDAPGPPPPFVSIKKVRRIAGPNPIVITIEVKERHPADSFETGTPGAMSRIIVEIERWDGDLVSDTIHLGQSAIDDLNSFGSADVNLGDAGALFDASVKTVDLAVTLRLHKADGTTWWPSTSLEVEQWVLLTH